MHWQGMDRFPEVLPDAATRIMAKVPLLFGIGMIENAYDQTAYVEALLPETLIEREMELLEIAKKRMGRLLFSDIDVLVIDQMGKEISGAGFDPNITGRNNRGVEGLETLVCRKSSSSPFQKNQGQCQRHGTRRRHHPQALRRDRLSLDLCQHHHLLLPRRGTGADPHGQ